MRLEKLKIFDSRVAGQSQLALTAGWRRVQAGKLLFRAGLQSLCGGTACRLQWLGSAVHAELKLAGGGEWPLHGLDFEVFVPAIILDGNSQIGLPYP